MKEYLSQKGVSYDEVDLSTDVGARKELMKQGIMAVPVVKIDEEYIVGFDKEKIDRML